MGDTVPDKRKYKTKKRFLCGMRNKQLQNSDNQMMALIFAVTIFRFFLEFLDLSVRPLDSESCCFLKK